MKEKGLIFVTVLVFLFCGLLNINAWANSYYAVDSIQTPITGIYTGSSSSEYGVYGQCDSNSTGGRGVYGYAAGTSGRGVYGAATGTSGRGVYGIASGTSGRGVYGYATASTGSTYGVHGRNDSARGTGV